MSEMKWVRVAVAVLGAVAVWYLFKPLLLILAVVGVAYWVFDRLGEQDDE